MSQPEAVNPPFAETSRQSAELHALRRMLDVSRDCFSLSVAVCNSPALRDYLTGKLCADDPSIETVTCPPNTTDVFGAVRGAAQAAPRTALFVVGLEDCVDSAASEHPALRSLNASRELWERTYRCPVVFWVPQYVAALLAAQALDWWRYRSHSFEFVSDQADARSGVADRFAGDVDAAAQLPADEKRFRIAELEQRVASAGAKPNPALIRHVMAWLNELAILHSVSGDLKRAESCNRRQLTFSREVGDRLAETVALGNLGNVYAELGCTRRAAHLYGKQLLISLSTGDRRSEGNALGSLGNTYADLGNPRRALDMYQRALAIAREIGDRRNEMNALGSIGVAQAALGDARRALDAYERATAIAREIRDRRGEMRSLGNLAEVRAGLGDGRQAISLYEQCLAIANQIGDRAAGAFTSWNLGLAYERSGDLPRAAELMQVLVDYEREIGHANAEKDAACLAALRARIK